MAAEEHVLEVVGQLQARSAIIAAAVAAGRLRVAGGLYDLDEGRETPVTTRDGGRTLVIAGDSTHDYVVGLSK